MSARAKPAQRCLKLGAYLPRQQLASGTPIIPDRRRAQDRLEPRGGFPLVKAENLRQLLRRLVLNGLHQVLWHHANSMRDILQDSLLFKIEAHQHEPSFPCAVAAIRVPEQARV